MKKFQVMPALRINFRFLTYLLLSLGTLGAVAFGVHRLQASRSAALLLTQARAAADGEQFPRAINYYARYVAFVPQAVEAKIEFGELLKSQGQLPAAYFQLESALRLEPEQPNVRHTFMEVAMELGRYAEAQKQLESYLLAKDPQDSELLWRLATCQQQLRSYIPARSSLQAAVDNDPENAVYAADLANLLTERLSQPDQAKQVLDRLVAVSQGASASRLARGEWILGRAKQAGTADARQRLLDSAWDDCLAAAKLSQDDPQVAIVGAEVAIARDDLKSARQLVEQALQQHQQTARLYGVAAQIALHEKNIPAAIQWLQRGLQAIPLEPDLMWNLAQLELDQGNVAAVGKLIDELRSKRYAEAPLRYLQARVLVLDRKWHEAAKLLEESRPMLDRSQDLRKQVDLLLATCYKNLGNLDQELSALRRVVTADPAWSSARQALGEALMRGGRTQEAIAEYRQVATQTDPPLAVIVSLTRLMFVETLNRGGTAPDWTAVERALKLLESHPAATDDWTVLKAELLLAQGQAKEAEKLLQDRIEAQPESLAVRQALVAVHVHNQDFDAADAVLTAAEASLPDSPELRLQRARYLVAKEGDKADSAELERLAAPLKDWSDVQRTQLAAGMAGYFQSIADYPRSVRYAQQAAETEAGKSDLTLHLLLFELAARTDDLDAMKSALQQVERIEGKGPMWRVGQAMILSTESADIDDKQDAKQAEQKLANYAAASRHLAEAAVARPGWSRIPGLQGELFERQGKTDQAIESYLQAIKLGEQNPQLISRVVFLLFEKGRFVEADEVIQKLQEQKTPFSSELTRVASQISLQLDNFDRALSLAERSAGESNTPEDHIWLAQVHGMAGNLEKAVQEFSTAIEMDPSQARGWVSLVQMYARRGDTASAEAALAEAKQAIDPEQAPDALAQCYQALGNNELASKHYQQAVEQHPQDAALLRRYASFCLQTEQMVLAQPLLERLVSPELAAGEADLAWGRRSLALLLGLDSSDKAFDRARKLLESNMTIGASSAEDQRTLAVVLSRRSDRASQDKAINILQGLIRYQPQFSVADYAVLAELYAKTRQWPLYSRTMKSILDNGGSEDPRFVRDYVLAMLTQGDMEEAQVWTKRLVSLAPEELSTATLEAELLFHAATYDRLLELIQTKAAAEESQLWGAELSEQFSMRLQQAKSPESPEWSGKFLELAKDLFIKVSESDPQRGLALASFHARQGDMSQSLAKLKATPDIPAEELAQLGQGALSRGQASTAELDALLKIAERELAKQPRELALGMLVGDLRSWLGKPTEAVLAYRQVLAVDNRYIPALNNLAMILALSGQELPQAMLSIEQAVAVAGTQFYLLDTRGMVRMAMGDYPNAEVDFRASIEGNPRPDQWFHLAQALRAQKRLPQAQAAFVQALEGGVTATTVHPLELKIFRDMLRQFPLSTAKMDPDASSK